MRRVAYFFPFTPLPAASGAARRCVEVLSGLRDLGCRTEVLFFASPGGPLPTGAVCEQLRRDYGPARAYEPTRLDYRLGAWLARARGWLGVSAGLRLPPYDSPRGRAWFRRAVAEASPDVLLTSYSFTDGLVGGLPRGGPARVIDAIDLWSVHARYAQAAQAQLGPYPVRPDAVPPAFLREDFYERLGAGPSAEELAVYDRYRHTLCISAKERALIQGGTSRTRVSYLPMTQAAVALANSYDGPALMVMRAHPFNLQGYCYLARRVLPRVTAPDFHLRVVGDGCGCVSGVARVTLDGFVPDLRPVYAASPFAVVPVFGGTGQQVKVVEAMAHGVPVVAIRQAAEGSPIEHGVNGLVAADAAEMAELISLLWHDRARCRRLGQAARETVAAHFSRERLRRGLAEALA